MHALSARRRHVRKFMHVTLVALLAGLLHVVGVPTPAQAQPPTAYLDVINSPAPGQLYFAGWAYDPDYPQYTISVDVYVAGRHVGGFVANNPRADVGPHGYAGTLDISTYGTVDYYLVANDLTDPGPTTFASGTITVADPTPLGAVESASSTAHRTIDVSGWASDADAPTSPVPISVRMRASTSAGYAETHALTANSARSDGRQGFNYRITTQLTGRQIVDVYAINVVGTRGTSRLIGSRLVDIYVDTTPPQTTITSAPRYATTTDLIRVEFSASETNATFQCRWDEEPWAACVGSTTISLATGNHMISVRASDVYGNADATPATAVVTVTAPAAGTPPPSAPAGPTVEARAVKRKSKLRIDVGPDSGDDNYRVVIQRRVGKKWRKVDRVRTRGNRDVVVVDLRRGKYRVVLPASSSAPAVVSGAVRLAR